MKSTDTSRPFRALLPALRPEWPGMINSYIVGTISALSLVALTVLSAWGVGHAVIERTLPQLWWWLTLIGLVIARTILTWREMDVSHSVAYRVLARLRMTLFDSYARSIPGKNRTHSGHSASVAMDDIEKLEFFYAHTVAQIATSITVFLASAITAFTMLPAAAGAVVLGGAAIATSATFWARTTRRLGADEQHERADIAVSIVDALGALREVLTYGLAPQITESIRKRTVRVTNILRRREILAQVVTSARELIVAIVVIGVVAASTLTSQELSPALLPPLIALAIAGISALTDATATATQLHPLTASAQRVSTEIHRPPVVQPVTTQHSLPTGPLGLRFCDVTFGYENREATLRSFNLDVAPGSQVGLSGPSGSGKSTLVSLASRLWDPDQGEVKIYGTDGSALPLTHIPDDQLRQAVAVVDQDATLFHGTVRENLLRGAPERSDQELRDVLDQVGATGWITLDDHVGQHGVRLSGGQQARLCLARALIRSPRILLVDEVTANLDPVTEQAISRIIAAYQGTVLMVSHREDTLAHMGRLVDLHNVEKPSTNSGS
ncbi:amino acid ABC transporter ATP-binding/permease protein [Devriesea agamarum]|uniref:amino acid ABC transporter ATP-binding/permease protein n=1 Tax=Devriesea agamarum TaxID=472569 RepID=UPI00071CB390|nr:ABC transporter ATP-binding protein [Devriesea agamarum]